MSPILREVVVFRISRRQRTGEVLPLPVLILFGVMLVCCCPSPFQVAPAGIVPVAIAEDGQGPAGPLSFTNDLGMAFVYIRPGSFIMGSPPEERGRNYDEIQHRVTLTKGFFMQTTEVTQGQWRAVMGEKPSHFVDCGDDCPVERVSLNRVKIFIRRLNKVDPDRRYRLPTEAEWEYACRAGSSRAFANGDIEETGCGLDPNLDKMGWYCGNAGETTHAVGQKQPNPWGLFDMHGNVFEWTADWYGDYKFGAGTDPTGPVQGWVIRGGSWNSYARFCRSASRSRFPPDFRNRYLGFRMAAEQPAAR